MTRGRRLGLVVAVGQWWRSRVAGADLQRFTRSRALSKLERVTPIWRCLVASERPPWLSFLPVSRRDALSPQAGVEVVDANGIFVHYRLNTFSGPFNPLSHLQHPSQARALQSQATRPPDEQRAPPWRRFRSQMAVQKCPVSRGKPHRALVQDEGQLVVYHHDSQGQDEGLLPRWRRFFYHSAWLYVDRKRHHQPGHSRFKQLARLPLPRWFEIVGIIVPDYLPGWNVGSNAGHARGTFRWPRNYFLDRTLRPHRHLGSSRHAHRSYGCGSRIPRFTRERVEADCASGIVPSFPLSPDATPKSIRRKSSQVTSISLSTPVLVSSISI